METAECQRADRVNLVGSQPRRRRHRQSTCCCQLRHWCPHQQDAWSNDRSGKMAAAARKAGGTDSDSTGSSSSSSDSSDEESEAKGLAALRAKVDRPRVPKITQPQRRQIVVQEDYHLERARRERADAERKRILRSPPDFSALHRSILVWNYCHQGSRPPAMAGKDPEYRRIQPHFGNANDYGSVFGPLLLLECWAQFQQAKEEAETSNASSIPSR